MSLSSSCRRRRRSVGGAGVRCFTEPALPGWNVKHYPSIDGSASTWSDAQVAKYVYRRFHDAPQASDTLHQVEEALRRLRFEGHQVSVLAHNSAMRVMAKGGSHRAVWQLYRAMLAHDVHPDRDTFSVVATALGAASSRKGGAGTRDWTRHTVKALLGDMQHRGFALFEHYSTVAAVLPATETAADRAELLALCACDWLTVKAHEDMLHHWVMASRSFDECVGYVKKLPGGVESFNVRHATKLLTLTTLDWTGDAPAAGHRAAADVFQLATDVGVQPDTAMYTAYLGALQPLGDTRTAAAVLAKMASERVPWAEQTYAAMMGVVLRNDAMPLDARVVVCEALWDDAVTSLDATTLPLHTALMRAYAAGAGHHRRAAKRLQLYVVHKAELKFTKVLGKYYHSATTGVEPDGVEVCVPISRTPLAEALRQCARAPLSSKMSEL